MRNLILFDDNNWKSLLPLTYSRPVGEIRLGITTLSQKWEAILEGKVSYITQAHLADKYPLAVSDDNILINSACLPTDQLVNLIQGLEINEALVVDDEFLAARLDRKQFEILQSDTVLESIKSIDISDKKSAIQKLSKPYEIFSLNGKNILLDFERLTKNRKSQPLSDTNTVIGHHPIFLEEGAVMEACILNVQEGPIYIGKNTLVMEGAMMRGPLAIGENAVVKMGAKLYKDTTIGPGCKVGGEVSNVVFQANSNKAHDGYLGNSVIGEWCNIGADTNNSNLKNTYEEVKLWSYITERFEKTGLQFCGLILADHAKCAINMSLNTGTVVGFSANLFGDGFPRNFVPSFSWGGASGYSTYVLEKAIATATRVMERRNIPFTDLDRKIFEYVFAESAPFRTWDHPHNTNTPT